MDDKGCIRIRQVLAMEVSSAIRSFRVQASLLQAAREETPQTAYSTMLDAVSLLAALRTVFLLVVQKALVHTQYPDTVAFLEASAHW